MSTAPSLEPDFTEPALLTNARRALDVATVIAAWDLDSFILVEATQYEVTAQTDDESQANALARALCKPDQEPEVRDETEKNGDRHLWLTVGSVRVICHQPAKQVAA